LHHKRVQTKIQAMNPKQKTSILTLWASPFFRVALAGITLRVILLFLYNAPTWFPDSSGYRSLAAAIANMNLENYAGWRTPGYPLMILLTFGKYKLLVFIQILMDIGTSYFGYDILRKYSQKLALIVSFFIITLLNNVFYSFSILTETSSLFLVTAVIWLITKYQVIYLKANLKITLIIAVTLMATFLVRPMFIYMSPILAVFMLFHINRRSLKTDLLKVFIILLFPFSAYFGWSTYNYVNHNWFTVSTYYGINLAQNSTSFVDEIPDEHHIIRDIYLKHIGDAHRIFDGTMIYDNQISADLYQAMIDRDDFTTIEAMSIWRAYGELQTATSLEGQDLSHELFIICKELIKNNPQAYSQQVIRNWLLFWQPQALPIRKENIINNHSITFIKKSWQIQRYILIFLSFLLIPITFQSIRKSIIKRDLFNTSNFLLAVIVAASILQALVTYGSNGRFSFPIIGLVIIVVSTVGLKLFKRSD
jgi:hypothetical protein